jgi:hypothetical protein
MITIYLTKWNDSYQKYDQIKESDAEVMNYDGLKEVYQTKPITEKGTYEVSIRDVHDYHGNEFDLIDCFYTDNPQIENECWDAEVITLRKN